MSLKTSSKFFSGASHQSDNLSKECDNQANVIIYLSVINETFSQFVNIASNVFLIWFLVLWSPLHDMYRIITELKCNHDEQMLVKVMNKCYLNDKPSHSLP